MLVVGRLLAPHGVRGWLKFRSYTEIPVTCFELLPWQVPAAASVNAGSRELKILQYRPAGDVFLVSLEGVDDRDQAQQLAGMEVSVPVAALPELDDSEFYWRELIGMSVSSVDGQALGTVADVMDNGAHDVLIVAGPDRERLIPFLEPYLRSVDRGSRAIVVDWSLDWD